MYNTYIKVFNTGQFEQSIRPLCIFRGSYEEGEGELQFLDLYDSRQDHEGDKNGHEKLQNGQ